MGCQVALALSVLLVAGLFLRSFRDTRDLDPGFRREGILLAAYDLGGRNPTSERARTFAARLLDRLRGAPGVEAAAIASSVPLDIHGLPLRSFTLEGRARPDGTLDRALTNTVTPGYFQTMGIAIVGGSDFADLEDASAPPQVIVNEEFVRRYLEGGEPIGRRVTVRDVTYTIAGVARTSTYDSFGEPPQPALYFSYRDRPLLAGEIHLLTRVGGEALLASEVRRAVRDLDPMLPVFGVRTLAQHVETNIFLRKVPARMFLVLGPLLLLLASIGIYAVVAYSVSHRTTEIGVRLALGATASRIVAQIVRESLVVILIGAVIGWMAVYGVYSHLVRGASMDLGVFAGVPALLLVVATLACWVPARRATSVDPMIALRHE
jgi:predicted permease